LAIEMGFARQFRRAYRRIIFGKIAADRSRYAPLGNKLPARPTVANTIPGKVVGPASEMPASCVNSLKSARAAVTLRAQRKNKCSN